MPDVAQNIVLTAVGGDTSASEIAKVNTSFNQIQTTSRGMEEQFSHRFTHIGLQLFSTDLLRANGLGGEARQIIGTMQTAIMGAGAAFGAAAGPIMLFGSALVAIVGLVAQVTEKHAQEATAIQKIIDTQSKAREGYTEEIKSFEAYQLAGGKMTKTLGDLLVADRAVADDIKSNLLVQQTAEIAALERQREELSKQQVLHNAWASSVTFVKTTLLSLVKEGLEIFIPELAYAAEAVAQLIDKLKGLVPSFGQHVVLTGQLKTKYDELTAAIAKMQLQHSATSKNVTGDIKAMTDALQHHKDVVEQLYLEMNKKREDALAAQRDAVDAEHAHELSIMDYHVQKYIEGQQKIVEEQQAAHDKMEKSAQKVTDEIGMAFGQAFAKMIVEGKSLQDSLSQAFTMLAEKFIEQVIEMAVEWAILQAVMDIWPGGAQAYQATAQAAYPTVAQTAYNSIGKQASGGDYMVDKPTMAMFGEAGPEIASFRPLGSPDSGKSGGGNTTVNVTLNVDKMDGNDPENTLRQLADSIRRETVAGRIFSATVAGVAGRYPNTAY